MREGLYYQIAGLPDRENLVAELWLDDCEWGEISNEDGNVVLELYPHPSGAPWRLDPVKVERLINLARRDLVEGRPPQEAARVNPRG